MTVQGTMVERYNSHRRDALADIFQGIDPSLQKRLVQTEVEDKKRYYWKRSKSVVELKENNDSAVMTEEGEGYVSRRRNALGDIYEGMTPELLKRLSPEIEKLYNSDDSCCTEDCPKKVTVKLTRSFSMVSENEMLKFNGFCWHERRNGVPDISEKLKKFEKKYLRNIYFANFTSPNSIVCY
jgi:hypothetical protein